MPAAAPATAAARRPQMRVRPTGPIVPPSNIQGNALMVVIAIMAFLACLTLGAVSMVRSTAASWESQISREITIQIKPDDNLDMEKALVQARDIAMTFVGTWKDQDVVKISLDRAQYQAINLGDLEEQIGQLHGRAFLELSTGKGTDASVAKANAQRMAAIYKKALGQLKGHAWVSPTLK